MYHVCVLHRYIIPKTTQCVVDKVDLNFFFNIWFESYFNIVLQFNHLMKHNAVPIPFHIRRYCNNRNRLDSIRVKGYKYIIKFYLVVLATISVI